MGPRLDSLSHLFGRLQNFVAHVQYDNKLVELALWDTAGQEDFDRLRPLSYNDTDVVLIVFAINHRPSLENVKDKVRDCCGPPSSELVGCQGACADLTLSLPQWHPEISHFLEGVPILLVGAKTDLRSDSQTLALMSAQGTQPVSRAEGEAAARDIGARYFECSSKLGAGVREVFEGALKESFRKSRFGLGRSSGGGGGGGGGSGKKRGCVVL